MVIARPSAQAARTSPAQAVASRSPGHGRGSRAERVSVACRSAPRSASAAPNGRAASAGRSRSASTPARSSSRMQAQRISLSGACRAALSRSSASACRDHPACGEAAPARGSRPLPHRRDPSHDSAPDSAPVARMIQRGHPDNARHHRHGTRPPRVGGRPQCDGIGTRGAAFGPEAAAILARRAQVACARFLHTGHRCVADRAPEWRTRRASRRSVDVTTMAITRRGFLRTAVAGVAWPLPLLPSMPTPHVAAACGRGRARRIRAVRRDVKLSRPPGPPGFSPGGSRRS